MINRSQIPFFLFLFSFFTVVQSADSGPSPHEQAAIKIQSMVRMVRAINRLAKTHPHLAKYVDDGITSGVERLEQLRGAIRFAAMIAEGEADVAALERGDYDVTPRTDSASSSDGEDHHVQAAAVAGTGAAGAVVATEASGGSGLLNGAASVAESIVSEHGSEILETLQDNQDDILEVVKDLFDAVRDGCRGCQRAVTHCNACCDDDEIEECCEWNPCWPLCNACRTCVDGCGEGGGCVVACAVAGLGLCACCCYKGTKKTYKCCEEKLCPWCYQKCFEKDGKYGLQSPAVAPTQQGMSPAVPSVWQPAAAAPAPVVFPSGVDPRGFPYQQSPAYGLPPQ